MITREDRILPNKIGFLASAKKNLTSDVLVIDDCKLQQIIVSHLLEELGLSYTCVNSITDAFHYMNSLNQNKLIISDMELGDGLGINFIKTVRNYHKNKQILSIAISSNSKYESIATHAGFDCFLKKPLKQESFNQAILNLKSNVQHCTRKQAC